MYLYFPFDYIIVYMYFYMYFCLLLLLLLLLGVCGKLEVTLVRLTDNKSVKLVVCIIIY